MKLKELPKTFIMFMMISNCKNSLVSIVYTYFRLVKIKHVKTLVIFRLKIFSNDFLLQAKTHVKYLSLIYTYFAL